MGEKLSRREQKKLYSRQAILDAATRLFQSRGLEDVSIADIMNEANLGIGTFYNYFGSKEDVLMELLSRIMQEIAEKARALSAGKRPVPDVLRELFLAAASLLAENRFVLPLFLHAAQQAAMPEGVQAEGSAPPFTSLFVRLVEAGQKSGEIRSDIPAAVITELFHSLFQAAAFSRLGISFEENVRMKLDLILDGAQAHKDRKGKQP